MNVMSFAQEFSSLVIRYTKNPLPNLTQDKNQPENVPLTKEEIKNVVSNVLNTLLRTSSVNNTSVNIPVATPTTPAIDNVSQNENDGNTCRSKPQDTQIFGTSNPDLRIDKTKEKVTLEVFQDGKKSRSSPAICVTNIGRSDTFVLEENQLAQTINDLKQFNDSLEKIEINSALLQSLNEIRTSATNIVAKVNDILKQASPHLLQKRRLSMSDTNSGRTLSMTKLSIPKVRRSVSDFPVTPTSSKSFATGSQETAEKRKSFGPNSAPDAVSRKFGSTTSVTRSISTLQLSSSNKSFDSNRPVKNPKYAHVQSTIPKPISSKRKAQ